MTMWDAPSDRDYAEYLSPSEPEPEDPDNIASEPEPSERWTLPVRAWDAEEEECRF